MGSIASIKHIAEKNKQKRESICGKRFNYFTVLNVDHFDEDKQSWFLCRCDCGKEFLIRGACIKKQKSCGCMTNKMLSDARKTHGESKTKLYDVWHLMKERCYRKGHKSYPDYGGRGIIVCDEWKNDYTAFRDWALRNGYDENAGYMECTLDRVDVNGNYEPSNCRWVSMKKQCNNRRNNNWLSYNGETHTMSEWAEITGIAFDTLWRRQRRGWDDERILTAPLRMTKRHKKKEGE